MKRIFSIVMLILFLLNVLGYYGVFVGLRFKNVQELVHRIDNDSYDVSETITFKVPLAVPYYTDSQDFERVDGEFEHNGEVYRMVKQRLLQDTLSIVCVKDNESKKINSALADYVKTFTDKPESSKQGAKTLQLIKDYISFSIAVDTHSTGWEIAAGYSIAPQNLIPSFASSIIHPPQRA
ncbi:MAG: hypothetical protein C0523_05820 [Cytophaga sp.]|nr:hypothetical protein [Cytophaga sp.]